MWWRRSVREVVEDDRLGRCTETITLTRDADGWTATDERTGGEGRGNTREQALERLDEARDRRRDAQIVKTPDVLGGKPRIDRTRIGVSEIGVSGTDTRTRRRARVDCSQITQLLVDLPARGPA